MPERRYAIRPDLRVTVTGDRAALRHFDAEYGSKATDDSDDDAELAVVFGDAASASAASPILTGGYKSVRWRVGVSNPGKMPLRLGIELGGRPLFFALSLIQGYFVEPLLSMAAAARGYVLVPAAALVGDDGAVLLMGRSGSGKSSLSARALAAGQIVLGDDQVLLDGSGTLYAFPRRMRFYSDIARTAPTAYRSMPSSSRAALVCRRALRGLSRGYIAPPVKLSPWELGPPSPRETVPLSRVAVVERSGKSEDLRARDVRQNEAVSLALELLDEQRAHVRRFEGDSWPAALARARAREESVLSSSFAVVAIERLSVPVGWDSRRVIDGLAGRLGVGD